MIDHTALYVAESTYQDALKLYQEALKPLGYEIRVQFGAAVTGMGSTHEEAPEGYKPADFWLMGAKEAPNQTTHIAFRAKGESLETHIADEDV